MIQMYITFEINRFNVIQGSSWIESEASRVQSNQIEDRSIWLGPVATLTHRFSARLFMRDQDYWRVPT